MKSKTKAKLYKKKTKTMKKGGNTFIVNIFTFCYNEEVMLPQMVEFYKSKFKNPIITVYDNESTDNSKSIAEKLGCISKTFTSGDKQSEDILKNLSVDKIK
jgi:ABC-type branched-subunit amino acid transport system substrate-binding protein